MLHGATSPCPPAAPTSTLPLTHPAHGGTTHSQAFLASGSLPVPLLRPRTSCPRCRALSPALQASEWDHTWKAPCARPDRAPPGPTALSSLFHAHHLPLPLDSLRPRRVPSRGPQRGRPTGGQQNVRRRTHRGNGWTEHGVPAGRGPPCFGLAAGAPADSRFRAGECLILFRPQNTTYRLFNIQSASDSSLSPLGTTYLPSDLCAVKTLFNPEGAPAPDVRSGSSRASGDS